MIRYFLATIALFSSIRSEELYLGDSFEPAKAGCEIIWAEGVRNIPETVPHYSATDHRFSQKTIRYFKELGGFTDKHSVPPLENLPSRKDSEVYSTEMKHLDISPVSGGLIYRYSQDDAAKNLEEAPTVESVRVKAKNLAVTLGFDLSSLALDHVRFTSGTRTRFDRAAGKSVTTRTMSGVFMPRLYDGWPSNQSGIQVDYGLGGELLKFSICWRDVKLAGQRTVPNRVEIAKRILQGRATVFMESQIKPSRLNIDRVMIYYNEAEAFRLAKTVEPILFLGGVAEADGVKTAFSMYLKLPDGS